MENRNKPIQSIGLFIDGGYYAKVNEALGEKCAMSISMTALMTFIRERISLLSGIDVSSCLITESHYFRGRFRANVASDKHLLFSERKFEDTLIENDVIFHYKHMREIIGDDGDKTVVEKGIDVWFALEAYELARIRQFDYVVLITGDADHEMLMRKLKALKIHTVLLTWDVDTSSTSTAKLLREEACTHIELSRFAAEDAKFISCLCGQQ